MAKRETGEFISELVDHFGAATIAVVLDTIKRLGFKYATQAGITISKNDIVIPAEQGRDPGRLRGARRRGRGASTSVA